MRKQPRVVLAAAALAAMAILAACGDDPPTAPSPQAVPLRLTGLSPVTGAANTSTPLVLTGSGFNDSTTLRLGTVSVTLLVTSSTTASATAPPHAVGAVDVVLTNANGDRAELRNGFQYLDLPTRIEITGQTALRAIGETAQLTATATFSDGRTTNVTSGARWSTLPTSVATVDAMGLVTARGLGVASITAIYPVTGSSRVATTAVTVTPSGSFAVSGRIREPGAGSVAGARVLHNETGQTATSASDGFVALGGLTGRPRLQISKEGYEDSEIDAVPDRLFDAPLQRVVRIAAGQEPYGSNLAPNDMDFTVGGAARCQPCRMLRVTSATPGPAQVTLRWFGSETLRIWVNGVMFEAPVGVREVTADIVIGPGDTLVFIGRPQPALIGDYIPFTVDIRQ